MFPTRCVLKGACSRWDFNDILSHQSSPSLDQTVLPLFSCLSMIQGETGLLGILWEVAEFPLSTDRFQETGSRES
jgi:hypothetical protein